jgi:hypothetical protein
MTLTTAKRHLRARIALAAAGLTVALVTAAYLWTFTGGRTFAPLIICLHTNDIACSNDYFMGRDRFEHLQQLIALLIGLAGLTLIAASGLCSRRIRKSTHV